MRQNTDQVDLRQVDHLPLKKKTRTPKRAPDLLIHSTPETKKIEDFVSPPENEPPKEMQSTHSVMNQLPKLEERSTEKKRQMT